MICFHVLPARITSPNLGWIDHLLQEAGPLNSVDHSSPSYKQSGSRRRHRQHLRIVNIPKRQNAVCMASAARRLGSDCRLRGDVCDAASGMDALRSNSALAEVVAPTSSDAEATGAHGTTAGGGGYGNFSDWKLLPCRSGMATKGQGGPQRS